MYKEQKVSVVMPAYNEEEYIATSVREFGSIPEVDEIIVVNNNSTDNTKIQTGLWICMSASIERGKW